jgi:prepilin peptidase CpaA
MMIILVALFALILIVISIEDCKSRIISNQLVIIIFFLSISYAVVELQSYSDMLGHIYSLLYVIGPAVLLFFLGVWGGGDAKLVMALAPITQPETLSLLIFLIITCGFVQAILMLLYRRLQPGLVYQEGMPYGVAISCGAIIFLMFDLYLL